MSVSNDDGTIEDDTFLFDLNGYCIVRNVLSPEEVAGANRAIDKRRHMMHERTEDTPALRNAKRSTPMYGTGIGRKDLGGVLEWELEDSNVYKSILAHPKLVPYYHLFLGKGYRLDHIPYVIAQDKGAEGFHLHGGTVDCGSGQYSAHLAYTYSHDTIRCALLGVNVVLTNHHDGDGGFCIVPGSHKANFKMPPDMIHGLKYQKFIHQPETVAGDVILFSEGTVHGAFTWTADQQRRVCLYRFAPATCAYGRSYFTEEHDPDGAKQT